MKPHFWTLTGTILVAALVSGVVRAAPVTRAEAANAAETFLVKRYPLPTNATAQTVTPFGSSHLAVQQVQPWNPSGQTIGFVATLTPAGYVLLSTDDDAPPVKLYSERGMFEQLPPKFLAVIALELREDLAALATLRQKQSPVNPAYRLGWQTLLSPQTSGATPKDLGPAGTNRVLLTTTWNQDDPYNYYCTAASGGSGGRAYAGCSACALGQILRFCLEPSSVAMDYSYTDNHGACQGTHSISDAGLGAYDWANMPNSISTGSSDAKKRAIGQLMYHAAVALDSDFEANNTSASLDPSVLPDYFGYHSGPWQDKSDYTSAEWFSMIATDIDAYRPIYYGLWESGPTNGHAVVCDGYRGTNEIHLNLGWSGSSDAWYTTGTVEAGGNKWTIHSAVFGITPPFIYVNPAYTNSDAIGSASAPFPTLADGYHAARSFTTLRLAATNYSETLRMSRPLRLTGTNGVVRIGTP
jgi:hypothetical protein